MYYVYIKRFDDTSTYFKDEFLLRAMQHASWSILKDRAKHVEISTNPPPVEGGTGVSWLR